ncbi:MAG: polysaccharide deacetylase family protein [Deltaproteobacteria bacterium]|nr:polysaccharide deacetylase family protein [Deltaproteobacteria bacterium]
MRTALPAIAALVAACQDQLGDIDGVFYDGDRRTVHCAVNLDTSARNDLASIDTALDRAAARAEVVELYAHSPGNTVPLATLRHVLEGARARGLAFVTYRDFADGGGTGPGLALSLDDHTVAEWVAARELFAEFGARLTFFVSRYTSMNDDQRAGLRTLADDGHDIEAHSVAHLRAPLYVEQHGVTAYLDDEVLPALDAMERDGFPIRAFAYPFGARTGETDRALLRHVEVLRSVAFSFGGIVQSPCPH